MDHGIGPLLEFLRHSLIHVRLFPIWRVLTRTLKMPAPALLPCDQCLSRKVRCDKSLPRCRRCVDVSISCTRDIKRKRPGRKKGSGNVISKLRKVAETPDGIQRQSREDGSEDEESRNLIAPAGDARSNFWKAVVGDKQVPNELHHEEHAALPPNNSETQEFHLPSNETFQRPADVLSTIPDLSIRVDLFFAFLYSIWPIIDEVTFRAELAQPEGLNHTQVCLVLSICALSALHIPETRVSYWDQEPRQKVAQRFIKQALHIRAETGYLETADITTIQTSLLLSCAEIEVHRARSSYFLLRECIILAEELGFYEPNLPTELSQNERLSIRRTLYLLSLVERGLTLLRNKPYAIIMFDSPPPETYANEDPRVLQGLQCLNELFVLLDKRFLDTWMQATASGDPEVLSQVLATQTKLAGLTFDVDNLIDIQKADILITQQWMRLVFWQLSMRQGLLSSAAEEPALTYQYPCQIAKSLCIVLETLPMNILFIHGMAIFERMFEVIYSFIDSLILSHKLSSEVDSLSILLRVLREAPNSHKSYIQILETKLAEQTQGDTIVALLRGPYPT
ncbi:hypothetical protein BJ878DRAFT_485977 [Calycina marina]|uniref:Zn(2)-C6 fungal-type domain-containing protein n=1 Tax=Calycina marina TaxID=1763456 RepID=A0A9P7ZBV0_9HELO|nr:hypothetical protein BJ878DRAFT_485977 [Calycina marina]